MLPTKEQHILFVSCLLFILFVATPRLFAQTTAVDATYATDIDASNFPEITLTFRAVDDRNGNIPNLSNRQIELYENNQQITTISSPVAADPVPAHIAFVIDRGQYANFVDYSTRTLHDALSQVIDKGHFRDEIDTVMILATSDDEPFFELLLAPTQSENELTNALDRISFTEINKVKTLITVEAAMDRLLDDVEVGAASLSIVYLGALVEGSARSVELADATALATNELRPNGIRFYTIHTEREGTAADLTFVDHFQMLSSETGGEYVRLEPGLDNSATLEIIYDDIVRQTATYQITYNAATSGDEPQREVCVVPPNTAIRDSASCLTYTVNLQAPTVVITADKTTYSRTGIKNAEGTYNWDGSDEFINLDVNVSWPDGIERAITSATLQIGATSRAIATDQSLSITHDIGDIEENATLTAYVEIEDAFGMTTRSNTLELSVTAETLDPTVNPNLTPTILVTTVVTREVVTVAEDDVCDVEPRGRECIQQTILLWAPWIGLLISLILLLILSYRFRQQLQTAGARVADVAKEVRKTLLGGVGRGQVILGKMRVITARKDLMGQEIDIYTHTTTFGRDPKLCDIQLYDEDDRSTVSGIHCTLQYDSRQHIFVLTDDNSAAGTKINNKSIASNDPIRLNDGDEIVLGDPFRRGAKLQFVAVEQQSSDSADSLAPIPEDTMFDDELSAVFDNNQTDPFADDSFIDEPFSDQALNDDTFSTDNFDDDTSFDDDVTELDVSVEIPSHQMTSFGEFADVDDDDTDWLSELE